MTVWAAESDWSTVVVGQRVRLVNSDGEVTFTVQKRNAWQIHSLVNSYNIGTSWFLFAEATDVTPVLADAVMRALGFTDRREGFWYFVERVGSNETINFSIDKATGQYTEDVLDEYFGQPAHYGNMTPKYGLPIRANIDLIVTRLATGGLNLFVDHTLYGCTAGEPKPASEHEIWQAGHDAGEYNGRNEELLGFEPFRNPHPVS
jgi:hypothetical protein